MLREQGFEHLRIWPRGVDTTLFQPQQRSAELRSSWLQGRDQPENKAILLYIGRLSWEKNLRLLVQAYRGMDHQDCHLVIVGDGPARSAMQEELADSPVTFTGYLSGTSLATAYASSDIFAFPSRTETFGQVVLEAMASDLPVVGLDSDGVRDLVTTGQTGLLDKQSEIEDEQITSYRALLTSLTRNHIDRYMMGRAAHIEAQRRSWPEAMNCLVEGYREVAEGSRTLAAV